MTATSLEELRNGEATEGIEQEKMEQIRQLLLGDHFARGEARLNRLEKRVDALAARIEALGGEVESDRRASFDELAHSVLDLSRKIERLGKQ